MNVIDLIREEVYDKYGYTKEIRHFDMKCSKAFREIWNNIFTEIGFEIPMEVQNANYKENIKKEIPNFKIFQIPSVGYIHISIMEKEGYIINQIEV